MRRISAHLGMEIGGWAPYCCTVTSTRFNSYREGMDAFLQISNIHLSAKAALYCVP